MFKAIEYTQKELVHKAGGDKAVKDNARKLSKFIGDIKQHYIDLSNAIHDSENIAESTKDNLIRSQMVLKIWKKYENFERLSPKV
jgi:hypothetical protein